MAWIEGTQEPRRKFANINKEIEETRGYINEGQAKILLYKFLYDNVALASELLMGIKLFPFQSIMIKAMLESDYTLGVLSRGGSKSFSTAIFAGLHALFNQGVSIGIISRTFRQCALPDSLVSTDRGLVQIKDVKVGDKVFSKDEPQKVLNHWENESAPCKRLTTKLGYSIGGKDEHRVLCESGEYKDLSDLKVGDKVAIQTKSRLFNEDRDFSNESYGLARSFVQSGVFDESILTASRATQRMFLIGCLDFAQRDPENNDRIFFESSNLKGLQGLQAMSLSLSGNLTEIKKIEKKYRFYLIEGHNEDLYYDEVESVVDIGSQKTIDIEVDSEHCYTAQGFVNHNSKMIFKKLEQIMESPEAALFKGCCGKMSKSSDEWHLPVGRSDIRALPLGDGEKLRGYRFHCVIIDEFLLMPEKTFNEVILPFLAVVDNPTERDELSQLEDQLIKEGKMKHEDKFRWPNNKLVTLSSASYKFEYMYQVYQKYEALITGEISDKMKHLLKSEVESQFKGKDNGHRSVIHLSYDSLPKALYDEDLVKQSLETMSQSQFEREFGAVFTEESSGFFKIGELEKCTEKEGSPVHVRIKGEPNKKYIISFDPSWSEDDGSDDWAMQVFEIDETSGKNILVHSYALPGQKMKNHIVYFHYILTNFNIVAVFGDSAGGTQFIRACNESKLFSDSKIELGIIDSKKLNAQETYSEGLRELKNQYNPTSKNFVFLVKFGSEWIRTSNELLQADINRNKIRFAALPFDDDWNKEIKKDIPISSLTFKKRESVADFDDEIDTYAKDELGAGSKKVDFVEHVKSMVEMTKHQCALIELTTSATGTFRFDLPTNLRKQTGPNKTRRDSYTSLFIGTWGCKVFRDMDNPSIKQHLDFVPKFIK